MIRTTRMAALAAAFIVGAATAANAESVSLNIFAIPSEPVVSEVAAVSDELKSLGMETFYAEGHEVHATLYLTNYPEAAIDELKAAVQKLATGWQPFPLTAEGIEVTKSNWVFVGIKVTPELQRLADEAVLAAEPLRDHDIQAPEWMKNYPDKLPAFNRYGSPNVFMQFAPHFTLLASEKNPKLADFVTWAKANAPKATGEVVGIALGRADANGQITEVLGEYRFGASN